MIRIQKYSIPILIIIAFTSCRTLGTASGGDTFPIPVEGWWKSLKGGETAVYETVAIPEDQFSRYFYINTKRVIIIEKVEGSNITVSRKYFLKGREPFKKTETFDVANDPRYTEGRTEGHISPEYVLKERNDTIIEAGGQRYNCTIYDVESKVAKVTKGEWWVSPQLPPIINEGLVKIVVRLKNGNKDYILETTLKSYNGSLL